MTHLPFHETLPLRYIRSKLSIPLSKQIGYKIYVRLLNNGPVPVLVVGVQRERIIHVVLNAFPPDLTLASGFEAA